ncbi:hypothetical protein GCM10011390_28470 [Aureimonas endophytica]|uniref:Quinol:cytochrome c oxidoreductase membrane protein n=1 Tax=Aureimonas endophytica TaxID=2027858 RepID=A0A917E7U5_9HYPH|nr:DUF3341 domain-containing protein [Aureimonas endophytica]GGE07739.1 hypothetical protein GCM10011390_28470 [Aureimonas endophytica]
MSAPRLLAEFAGPRQILLAARQVRQATGFFVRDAYTPFAVEGLAGEIEGLRPTRLRLALLLGGLAGGLAALLLQWLSVTQVLPMPAGGRALASWPDFFFAIFEMTILGAGSSGFVALLVGCGLPRLHHPIFDLPGFERATQDRFFLEVETGDAAEAGRARAYLKGLGALSVAELPR